MSDTSLDRATGIETGPSPHPIGALPRRPLAELESLIGYAFSDARYLTNAMVHKSYLHEVTDSALPSNERLEFLGDAVLGLIVSADLFRSYPDVPEGRLSALRGALVRLNTLAEIAEPMSLGEYLYMSHGEEAAGGRTRPSNLGRALEALLGAVYLDGGLEAATNVWHQVSGERTLEQMQQVLSTDYKSQLQQVTQAEWHETPRYRLTGTSGPDHSKQFHIEVVIGDRVLASGIGRNKQIAEQSAAEAALVVLAEESGIRNQESEVPTIPDS
jgi:ribonuclease-3